MIFSQRLILNSWLAFFTNNNYFAIKTILKSGSRHLVLLFLKQITIFNYVFIYVIKTGTSDHLKITPYFFTISK